MVISKLSLDDEVKEIPAKECFCYLDIADWELQRTAITKMKDGKLSPKELTTEEGEPSTPVRNPKNQMSMSFLFPGSSSSAGVQKVDHKSIVKSSNPC